MRAKEEIIAEMGRCKTREKAILLAAEFVLVHSGSMIRVTTLEKKFGDALLEVLEGEGTANE